MRILITGATGFIGGRLLSHLTKMGHEVLGIGRHGLKKQIFDTTNYSGMLVYCDIEDYKQVRELMGRFRPEIIFHLGGNPIVKENLESPCDITKTNFLATHHLLATCPLNSKFVFASSATVYGDYKGEPFKETDIPNPTSVYGVTKLASEQLVEVYSKQRRVRGVIARLIANCGKGATHGVFCDIVKKLRCPSHQLNLFGVSPGSCKPFMHVADTVNVLSHLGLSDIEGGIYNVSAYDKITIREVAEIIMKAAKIEKPISWMGKDYIWQGDNQNIKVCSEKMEKFYRPVSSYNSIEQAAQEEF